MESGGSLEGSDSHNFIGRGAPSTGSSHSVTHRPPTRKLYNTALLRVRATRRPHRRPRLPRRVATRPPLGRREKKLGARLVRDGLHLRLLLLARLGDHLLQGVLPGEDLHLHLHRVDRQRVLGVKPLHRRKSNHDLPIAQASRTSHPGGELRTQASIRSSSAPAFRPTVSRGTRAALVLSAVH
eukprot:7433948-Pyramimonas_sp.AAC.1